MAPGTFPDLPWRRCGILGRSRLRPRTGSAATPLGNPMHTWQDGTSTLLQFLSISDGHCCISRPCRGLWSRAATSGLRGSEQKPYADRWLIQAALDKHADDSYQ